MRDLRLQRCDLCERKATLLYNENKPIQHDETEFVLSSFLTHWVAVHAGHKIPALCYSDSIAICCHLSVLHAPLILNHLPIPHMQRQPPPYTPPPLPHARMTLLFQVFRRKPNDTTSAYSALVFVMSVPEPCSDSVVAAAVAVTASPTQGPGWGGASNRVATRGWIAAAKGWSSSSDAQASTPPTQLQPAAPIKSEEGPRYLNIKIKTQDGGVTHFKLKDTSKMNSLFLVWCQKHSHDMRTIR